MLLAVEGGGFFSSSASGYSSGLALLILGKRDEEKPIKVSPWINYHLVEQEHEPDSRTHSRKDRGSPRCASYICFGCSPTDLDGPSPSNVSLVQKSDTPSDYMSSSDGCTISPTDDAKRSERKACLKSNLKKPTRDHSLAHESDDACELLDELQNETSCCTVSRKVQWTDKCGKELVEIREFEASDYSPSDDEYDRHNFRRCECVIQ